MDRFLSHIAEKRTKLQKQLQKLQADLADLEKAERLYQESGAASKLPPMPPPPAPTTTQTGPSPLPLGSPPPSLFGGGAPVSLSPFPGGGKTIKERVLQLLECNPGGLTSSQILNNLNIDGGQPVSRESLSPQLSRLRNEDHKIDLNGGLWTIKKHEAWNA